MPSTAYPGYTNASVTITVNGSYTGDGINGWAAGTANSFSVRERRLRLNGAKQDSTDAGYQSQRRGPVGVHVELMGYFKTGTIPPIDLTDEFVYISAAAGFTLTAVLMVSDFECIGVIDQNLNYRFVGDTDGTFTFV